MGNILHYSRYISVLTCFLLCSGVGSITTASDTRISKNLLDEIDNSIGNLKYSSDVAKEMQIMVQSWEQETGDNVLNKWKEDLSQAKFNFHHKIISENQIAHLEENISKELMKTIRTHFTSGYNYSDLDEVMLHRQGNCLGLLQLYSVLGIAIGIDITPILVEECKGGLKFYAGSHTACLVNLSNNSVIEVDLLWNIASEPFNFEITYHKEGYFWILQDKNNSLGIHKSLKPLTLNGVNSVLNINRGCKFLELKQYDQAIKYFNIAVEYDSSLAEAIWHRGNAYDRNGDYTRAITDYSKVLELDNNQYYAYCDRGEAYRKMKQYDKAMDDCTTAIKIDKDLNNAYITRGLVYCSRGEYDKAIDNCSKAVDLDVVDPRARSWRGYVNMCFKHYEDGIIDYKITVILNPKASEAFYNLGVAYTILGSTQEASENFSKAIELQPELETYHQRFLDQWNTKMTSDSIENLKKPSYVDNSSTFQTGKSGSRVPHVHRTCWVRCTRSQRKCCTSLKRP